MKSKINWEKEKDKIENLLKEGKTIKELSEEYNVSTGTMRSGIKNHITWFNIKRARYTEKEIETIKNYLDNDKSIEEIASALGESRTPSAVKDFIIKHRKEYNFSYAVKRYNYSKKEIEEIKRVYSEGYTSSETARKLGFNVGSVQNIITRLNLDNSENKEKELDKIRVASGDMTEAEFVEKHGGKDK